MTSFKKRFNPYGLRVPQKLFQSKTFRAAANFSAPKELILTGYCVPVDDQGSLPWCAAYSAANFAENLLWRKRGYHVEIDPAPLYSYAKTIDGDPNADGTYLECTLEALVKYGHFDGTVCKVKTFGNPLFNLGLGDPVNDMKYAIHKYGVCMAGFQITGEWFNPKKGVVTGSVTQAEGGHAVLVVGYDEDGFIIQNSWGKGYAHEGFVYLTNKAFREQFMYGALLTRALDGLS